MEHSGREHPFYMVVPGTPAPRGGALSRVVAANGSTQTRTSNITQLASRSGKNSAPLPASQLNPISPITTQNQYAYVPYVHVGTGSRAMIPVQLDPATLGGASQTLLACAHARV